MLQMQGLRPNMEDASVNTLSLPHVPDYALFGIFDGHLGTASSQYVSEHISSMAAANLQEYLAVSNSSDLDSVNVSALKRSFSQLDKALVGKHRETSGSCAIVALVRRKHKVSSEDASSTIPEAILVANLGDSRAVLGRKTKPALALSEDHKPGSPTESERIEAAGGEGE
jgi:protein phosphatase 1L